MTAAAPSPTRSRGRLALGAGALVLLVAVLAVLLAPQPEHRADLDPENPGPAGTQALARVLAAEGVDVNVARGIGPVEAEPPEEGTTLLVGWSPELTVGAVRRAMEAGAGADRVVVLAPDNLVANDLGFSLRTRAPGEKAVPVGCKDAGLRDDLTVTPGGPLYRPTGTGTVCFTPDGAAHGHVARIDARDGRPEVWVVGSTTALSNAHLAEAGNAATAMRILGAGSRLVWYQPQAGDTPVGSTGSKQAVELAPRWAGYVATLLASAVIVSMLWRGRRLGRLVREPLPVLVHAGEITHARGQLYRRARDSQRAGKALQIGSRRRLAQRFGVPSGADPTDLVAPVAAVTGRDPAEVHAALFSTIALNDTELRELAARLATIEEEVRGR